MQVLEAIASRFIKSPQILNTLISLTNIRNVVVAGGIIAFPDTSNDIDIFILNQDQDAWKQALFLMRDYSKSCFIIKNDDYQERLTSFSVIEIRIDNESIHFQFIFTDFQLPESLLNNFDFDYIRIGLHLGNLCYAKLEQYKQAHETKTISWCSDRNVKILRFQKAILKGFQTVIICNKYIKESQAKYQPERLCKIIQTTPTVMGIKTSTDLCFVNFEITGIHFENMRQSDHLLFPCFELRDKSSRTVLHAKYVSVAIYVIDEYHIELAHKPLIKIKNKSSIKLEEKQHYVAVVELVITANDNKIRCYIIDVNTKFLPISILDRFWQSIAKYPKMEKKWDHLTNEIDHLFSKIADLLLAERLQIVPNFRSVTKILDNDIYKYCGDASLLMEVGMWGSVQTFEEAERYLDVQYLRFAGTKFTDSSHNVLFHD